MNVEIADKLVELRKKTGLSQEELAEKIGVSRQAISKWERAESSPDTDNLIALSRTYHISIDKLLDANVEVVTARVTLAETSYEKKLTSYFELHQKNYIWLSIITILLILVYLSIGFAFDLWHPGWVMFLSIPIFYLLAVLFENNSSNDKKSKPSFMHVFPVPILIFAVFIILYMNTGWAFSWLVFLLIPVWAYFIGLKKG